VVVVVVGDLVVGVVVVGAVLVGVTVGVTVGVVVVGVVGESVGQITQPGGIVGQPGGGAVNPGGSVDNPGGSQPIQHEGLLVGVSVGLVVGVCVGLVVGVCVGLVVDVCVGECVGLLVGECVGLRLGDIVGDWLGVSVGLVVGVSVGVLAGSGVTVDGLVVVVLVGCGRGVWLDVVVGLLNMGWLPSVSRDVGGSAEVGGFVDVGVVGCCVLASMMGGWLVVPVVCGLDDVATIGGRLLPLFDAPIMWPRPNAPAPTAIAATTPMTDATIVLVAPAPALVPTTPDVAAPAVEPELDVVDDALLAAASAAPAAAITLAGIGGGAMIAADAAHETPCAAA